MLSKNPLDIASGKKLDKDSIAQALRLAIIGELDAINLYLQLASAVDDAGVKKVLEDIAEEEKVHVGELLELLKKLDVEQAEALEKGTREVKELLTKC
ncbi:rubrerythrin [Desulfurococcaceae archaeon MEX13E-LK6-19]|nr:rubrerythrin [Desulfurococcaceae archaeon MEX13E-LK6-19]